MLTDSQMMLLEQLTYIDKGVASKAGISYSGPGSVREMLAGYTESALEKLENTGGDGFTKGSEYAAIIRAIQSDPELMALELTAFDSTGQVYCFNDPAHPDEAVVAFRGTYGGAEWKDDADGLVETDTICQKRALDFIDGLDYEHISVVGHSKGGNKAQYVALLSDKVDKCVSMDGQGFCNEFLEKYSAEIEANAHKIKNYSLDTDYVHILLNPIPGSQQIYCASDPNEAGFKNHASSSFYRYYIDENGDYQLVYDKNGNPLVQVGVKENEMMTYLNGFTCFILNTMPADKKLQVAEFVGNILAFSRDSNFTLTGENGVVYSGENMMLYILDNKESAEIVLAYLAKYVKTYGLSEEQVRTLLDAFGYGDLIDNIYDIMKEKHLGIVADHADDFCTFILDELTDGEKDPVIEGVLAIISGKVSEWASDQIGQEVNIQLDEVWQGTEQEYNSIPPVSNPNTANKPETIEAGKGFDFTSGAYGTLVNVIDTQINNPFPTMNWSSFAHEGWYSELGIDQYKKTINDYAPYLDNNDKFNKTSVERLFENEWDIDATGAANILDLTAEMRYIGNLIKLTLRPISSVKISHVHWWKQEPGGGGGIGRFGIKMKIISEMLRKKTEPMHK